jgi:hypothetical protein
MPSESRIHPNTKLQLSASRKPNIPDSDSMDAPKRSSRGSELDGIDLGEAATSPPIIHDSATGADALSSRIRSIPLLPLHMLVSDEEPAASSSTSPPSRELTARRREYPETHKQHSNSRGKRLDFRKSSEPCATPSPRYRYLPPLIPGGGLMQPCPCRPARSRPAESTRKR